MKKGMKVILLKRQVWKENKWNQSVNETKIYDCMMKNKIEQEKTKKTYDVNSRESVIKLLSVKWKVSKR